MCEKLKILDDFCWDIGADSGYDGKFLYISKSLPDYLIKEVKRKARKLGIRFRTKKDYIDFFVQD